MNGGDQAMTTESTDSEDFYCGCSDDEKYNPMQNPDPTIWESSPAHIIELYDKVAKGDPLELDWKCPGRRDPSPEAVKTEKMEVQETENAPNENEEKPPTEFDFDDMAFDRHPVTTPMRTPGASRTPRSVQKRVARLDKILDDLTRHKKLNRTKSTPQKAAVTTPVAPPSLPKTTAVETGNEPQIVPTATPTTSTVSQADTAATDSKPELKKEESMEESASPPSPPLPPPPPPVSS